MTPQEAKELLPIIEAYARGEAIQYRFPPNDWEDARCPQFTDPASQYRIKPKPRLVEMTHEDLPPIFWVQAKGFDSSHLVTKIGPHGEIYVNGTIIVLKDWRWSTDRKNWQDFTKEVTE